MMSATAWLIPGSLTFGGFDMHDLAALADAAASTNVRARRPVRQPFWTRGKVRLAKWTAVALFFALQAVLVVAWFNLERVRSWLGVEPHVIVVAEPPVR